MADNIRFNYDEMGIAAGKIDDIAAALIQAANTFQGEFMEAISGWEGESKEKMAALVQGSLNEYLTKSVPGMVTALSQILRANITEMQSADQQIADSIPASVIGN